MNSNFTPNTKVRDLFIEWLEQFDNRHARAWAHRYHNDPEAAMCEAFYWGVLQNCGVTVEPNENLSSGCPSPDFRCSKNGERFYVEVACLHIDRVTKETSLPHCRNYPTPRHSAQMFAPLNSAIFEKVRQKTPQCANLDAPALVAVGTFHHRASSACVHKDFIEWLLTGKPMISWTINTRTGAVVKQSHSTKLKQAAFLKPGGASGIEKAREPVSGMLVGGFGCSPPDVFGILHPNAIRPFNRTLLDRIEFCRLICDDANRPLSAEWI